MSDAPHPHWRPARLLDDGRRLAAIGAVVFVASLFMPWYEKSVIPAGARTFATTTLSAFGTFTWIEAALLLVDAAVLLLIYLRSTGRRVELPGSDGTIVALAGGWMIALLIVRVFDRPSIEGAGAGATVGLQWGLLVAMAAAGAILASGLAQRSIERVATPSQRDGGATAPSDEPLAGAAEGPVDPSEAPTRLGGYGASLGDPPIDR